MPMKALTLRQPHAAALIVGVAVAINRYGTMWEPRIIVGLAK